MRPNPRFEWRLEALSAERVALNAQIERRQMRGNRDVKRVQQNLHRAMEPSEEAWRKTLIARLCWCFRCSREPSAPWAAQHQRLREHWRLSALQWMSDQELDDTGAGHPGVEVRIMPSWPRSWANFSLLLLHSHRNRMHGPTRIFWADLTRCSLEGPRWTESPEHLHTHLELCKAASHRP